MSRELKHRVREKKIWRAVPMLRFFHESLDDFTAAQSAEVVRNEHATAALLRRPP